VNTYLIKFMDNDVPKMVHADSIGILGPMICLVQDSVEGFTAMYHCNVVESIEYMDFDRAAKSL
jgi:hypothetical protein